MAISVKRGSANGGKQKRKRGPDKQPRKRRTDGATNHPKRPPKPRLGKKAVLPNGAVSAIKQLRHRVPEGTDPLLADVAGEAFEAIVEVMRRPQAFTAYAKLTAARYVREEVCGPMKQHVQVDGFTGLAERLTEARNREIELAKTRDDEGSGGGDR